MHRYAVKIQNLIVVLFLLTVPPASACAGEAIVFALFARGWEPFEMIEDGVPAGAAPDILAAILPQDFTMEIKPDPAPRKALYATEGVMHTRLEAAEWLSPDNDFLLSVPVLPIRTVLYSPVEAPVEYDGPETAAGKTIGCIKGYKYPALEPLFATGKATRYDVNSVHILLRMVKNRRIDAAMLDDINAKWTIRSTEEFEHHDFHVAAQPVSKVDLRFVFNNIPGWEEKIERINKRIEACRKDGTIRAILSNYE
ncbi:substrate-binding periplasmic protein [Pseudodesulfovibrio senegalensis]|uniref:Transporter substrate-binding domain-containing protein n=1 Tax=Pseudodesulfovibrio senegalensis TaxID=1721087 RepID=A0A6N6N259_9BACT|nr:transporter substrate-binding domain-containing protein [Pseudodesulfovibrio senegalensis]KAB1441896.1 transporter substrate-binding domain-containing protein [Pseudodesulfovibrio senegalensis]